ncbi:TIGR02221 family CRISPR-associated protein [Hydrogenobacter hydrogenophilus]|uniref:CRISPR-associated protein, TM1812 family n=1 Tax=Hydrogenobacter hydrogenophilus TaxID=35835 RepID=A0A285NVF3_9AQUI|nr:TIGR02221 family CRISPR-associated protein [Hydrogenobacter hydrogenophilus]SNZ11856.1 CRISPR-associated protein, TM1812 family [Hydrogenobacter hydrogenophilus]
MADHLLVSFIGKATKSKEEGTGYQKITYRFEDGSTYESSFFTVAIHRYLRERQNIEPDLLIVGTSGSTWGELFQLSESEQVFEIASSLEKGFDHEKLKRLEDILSEDLGVRVRLLSVEDNPPRVLEIAKEVFNILSTADYKEVFLDITHSYRYMPYSVLSAFMIYKNLRDFRLRIFYGFLEYGRREDPKPAYELTDISHLLDISNAVSLITSTGDFRAYYDKLGAGDVAKRAYYKIETNQQPRTELKELMKFKPPEQYDTLHKEINRLISELDRDYLDERMVSRAKFFADRGQYLKAIVLLYEAFIVLACRKQNRQDCNKYKTREEIRDQLRNNEKFEFLSHLRNVIVHGSQPEGKYGGEIQRILGSEEEFKKVFEDYLDYYYRLKENK